LIRSLLKNKGKEVEECNATDALQKRKELKRQLPAKTQEMDL
jgi:hypothetical protein